MSKSPRYRVLDDELYEHIAGLDPKEQQDWLFLAPHEQFGGRWYVDALHPGFFFDFKELIGQYRTVSPASLGEFLNFADELDYKVVFVEDPVEILKDYEHLNDAPAFRLNSDMHVMLREKGEEHAASVVEKTGMLPFQVQGFNYLRRPELKGGFAMWSTGTGKTALEAALIKQHMEIEQAFDFGLVVVKSNNKYDTQIKLFELGGIESFIIEGTPAKRRKLYEDFTDILNAGYPLVAVTNYEKFRDDEEHFADLMVDRRVLIFWDEMPTKLRNRTTQLYQSVGGILYSFENSRIKWDEKRPSALRQYELSATPIENSPVDQLNCTRLIDPDVFPSINSWETQFVQSRNRFSRLPETFKNLDRMGLMLDFMTHQVDKEDPDIARMFPEVREQIRYVDWTPKHRKVYDELESLAAKLSKDAKEDSNVKALNAFQLIGVLQMLCDAPSMVTKSAQNREDFEALLEELSEEEGEQLTPQGSEAALMLVRAVGDNLSDEGFTKLAELREILCEKHPDEKVVVFSRLAGYIQPVLEEALRSWGVTYVVYRGSDKQRQEAKDQFRNDPNIRVLLSSDAGSDGIDLPEASVAVDYDLPLKWSTKTQRRNRIHRVNSTFKYVTFYTLLMANSVEERILKIVEKKHGFHKAIFKGEIADNAISARMTEADLMYLLTGTVEDDTLV